MTRMSAIFTVFIFAMALLFPSLHITAEASQNSALVDINSGDARVLSTLPGIGKSTAEKIIKYRTDNGSFKKKEEIMKVNGIGAKKFAKIKDLIVVSEDKVDQKKKE